VAEGYYQNLAITAIVTPSMRAVDEKTGLQLMGKYQELRMQLDGKYHKDSFCVVVSKTDDIDCDSFCKGNKEGRQDAQLQAQALEIKSTSIRVDERNKELRTIDRQLETMTRKCASLKTKIEAAKRASRPPFTPSWTKYIPANQISRQEAEGRKAKEQTEQLDERQSQATAQEKQSLKRLGRTRRLPGHA
jgi:chromosome segregation ATPase